MKISAPYPAIQATSFMPDSQYNDPLVRKATIVIHTSIGGTRKTFIQRNPRYKISLIWTDLTLAKRLEIETLLKNYADKEFLLELPYAKNQRWRAYLATNPFQGIETGQNIDTVNVEFEGLPL